MKKSYIIATITVIILISGLIFWGHKEASAPAIYDDFAKCLDQKGAKFYGAFWCPHCQREKALFGKSKALLPYVECSTPDGAGQTQICIDKKIQSYPTWIFADGSQLTGESTLEQLSEKSGCPLPSSSVIK